MEVVVRSVVVYLATLVGLRLMGKRELGLMTVFDLVVILLIATRYRTPWSDLTRR